MSVRVRLVWLIQFDVRRFKGFLQIYQLQTENDEEETWRDLVRGFSIALCPSSNP